MNLQGKTVGIVGFGVEGKSTYMWLQKHRVRNILVFDEQNTHLQDDIDQDYQKEIQGVFSVSFGKSQEFPLRDADGNIVWYQKGNRRHGFNHFKKHLNNYSVGHISQAELVQYIPIVLRNGKKNTERSIAYENGEYSEVIEYLIEQTLFQVVVRYGVSKAFIVSFFSNRYFTVYEKAREGLHLDQPNSRNASETIIAYREDKYQGEKKNDHTHTLKELPPLVNPTFFPFHYLSYTDILFRSPGVHPEKITNHLPKNWKGKMTSATKFFLDHSPTKQIIGVTGTKGKGTTSALIAEILKEYFRVEEGSKSLKTPQVFLGGNIGTPVFDFFDALTPESIVVLELSSFQLYDVHRSPKYAVLLRTDSEHLDWHSDLEDYRNAKKHLFAKQSKNDFLVYFGNSSIVAEMVKSAQSHKCSVLAPFCQRAEYWIDIIENCVELDAKKTQIMISDIALRGTFHHENVLAAIAIAKQFSVSDDAIKTVLRRFTGLPMRMEKICEKDGRTYYNDSFSTIPETTISALSTFQTPVFLILGGSEKYSDFTALAEYCASYSFLQKIYLIGVTASRIAKSLQAAGFFNFVFAQNLQEIVSDFRMHSKKGDSLVLSPGCASFGMFKNYKERGMQFESICKDLQEG